jgi:hypothetical protein
LNGCAEKEGRKAMTAKTDNKPPSALGSRKKRDIAAERRDRARSATTRERALCRAAYNRHREACLRLGVAPSPLATFEAEWLQLERAGLDEEKDEDHRHAARDYERQFSGLRWID